MMKPTHWIPLAATLWSLCVPSLLAEKAPDSPAATEPAQEQPSVVYTELQPITVRARVARSPKDTALRIRIVSGRTRDRLDRGVMRESPKLAALRERRGQGLTFDLLDRDVPVRSPKAEAALLSQD